MTTGLAWTVGITLVILIALAIPEIKQRRAARLRLTALAVVGWMHHYDPCCTAQHIADGLEMDINDLRYALLAAELQGWIIANPATFDRIASQHYCIAPREGS